MPSSRCGDDYGVRKVSDKVLEVAQYVGLFLILALLIYVNGNDFYRFFLK